VADKQATLLLRIKEVGSEALEKVKDNIETIGKAAAIGFGIAVAAVIKSVAAYREQEEATNALTRTMVNNGTYTKELRDSYLDQASALQKLTLFGDEQIVKAQAVFSQQARGITLTQANTKAILDFAQAQGIDAAQAAELVGKSVGTATNALGRYGIEVSATASKSEKMAQVMAGLNSKFGGQAEAATSGYGVLTQLSVSIGDLFEVMGEKLGPTINFVARELLALTQNTQGIENFATIASDAFNFVTKIALSVAFAFQRLGTTVGATMGTLAGSLQLLIDGQVGAAKDALVNGFSDIAKERERIQVEHDAKMAELDAVNFEAKKANIARDEQLQLETLARKNEVQMQDTLSSQERELNDMIAFSDLKSQTELAKLSGSQSAIYAAEVAQADRKLKLATTSAEKVAALSEKYRATEQMNQAKFDEATIAARQSTFATISTLSRSNNRHLATIGKAAALAQIAMDTPVAIGRALASAPPPFNFVLAGAVGLAMAAQTADVMGVQLAEGGIVMPRPGGIQATIGEAGQAEAVIPLDRAGEFGLGGGGGINITLIVNGGMLGSDTEAREFAMAIDKELLKLRRNNESVSFDSGVI
jgi:hypothetical protein